MLLELAVLDPRLTELPPLEGMTDEEEIKLLTGLLNRNPPGIGVLPGLKVKGGRRQGDVRRRKAERDARLLGRRGGRWCNLRDRPLVPLPQGRRPEAACCS